MSLVLKLWNSKTSERKLKIEILVKGNRLYSVNGPNKANTIRPQRLQNKHFFMRQNNVMALLKPKIKSLKSKIQNYQRNSFGPNVWVFVKTAIKMRKRRLNI